jgi:hypothetical protein
MLMVSYAVVVVMDEQFGNLPRYIQILIALRPFLCLAFLSGMFVVAVRRKWLTLGWKGGEAA